MSKALVPSSVLAAYAEPLLEGRRVIVFGDSSSDLALTLVDRGARVVHFYDADPSRAAESAARNRSRNVAIAPLADSDLAVRDGAFDVALVENLAAASERERLLSRVRRSLSPRGVAFFAAPNPEVRLGLLPGVVERGGEPLGYYDLYDLVADAFSEVQMLGQAPFAGYAVVDFSHEGDRDISFDSAYVPRGSEEPEWFVAVASEHAVELDPFAVIQLPLAATMQERAHVPDELPKVKERAGTAPAERDARRRLERLETEAEALRQRAEAAEQARDRLLAATDEQRREVERLRAELAHATEAERAAQSAAKSQATTAQTAEQLRNEVLELHAELGKRDAWIGELEARATAADARADDALERLEIQSRSLAEQQDLAQRFANLERERAELLTSIQEKDARIAALAVEETAAPDDFAELESALRERAEQIRSLEAALENARRVGHELVRELEQTRALAGGGESPREIARLRADLEAAQWTIEELEGRLEAAARSPGIDPQKELEAARAELERRAQGGAEGLSPR